MDTNVQTEAQKAPQPGPVAATPPAATPTTTTTVAGTAPVAVTTTSSLQDRLAAALERDAHALESLTALGRDRLAWEKTQAAKPPTTGETVLNYTLGISAGVAATAVALTLAATAVSAIRNALSDDDDRPALPPSDHDAVTVSGSSMESL